MSMEFDGETGEIISDRNGIATREPLSTRAVKGSQPRRHWDRAEGLVLRTPDEQRESEYELAFLAAQMEIATVIETDAKAQISKDRGYTYTTLGQLMNHVRPILHKHGFTFKQGTGRIHKMGLDAGNQLYMPIYLKLTFVGTGESETYVTEMPLTKLDPQAVKSAKTYGKRQLIEDTFGIASADDDAIAAMAQRSLSRDDEAGIVATLIEKIQGCKTVEILQKVGKESRESIANLSEEARNKCADAYKTRLEELREALEAAAGKEEAKVTPIDAKAKK
jgi:hypothetical protein